MAPLDADGHEHANPDNIDDLSIKDGELYWKKKKLRTETRQKLVLSFGQKVTELIQMKLMRFFYHRDTVIAFGAEI